MTIIRQNMEKIKSLVDDFGVHICYEELYFLCHDILEIVNDILDQEDEVQVNELLAMSEDILNCTYVIYPVFEQISESFDAFLNYNNDQIN